MGSQAANRLNQLLAILQADETSTLESRLLARARADWLQELRGPKYGKWWLHRCPLPLDKLERLLSRAEMTDAAAFRRAVQRWAEALLRTIEADDKARRQKWKDRANVRHYRIMARGQPPEPAQYQKLRDACDAGAALWSRERAPVGVFEYLEDWSGPAPVGYRRVWDFLDDTLVRRRELVYRGQDFRMAPGEDPNELVQLGQSPVPTRVSPSIEWLEPEPPTRLPWMTEESTSASEPDAEHVDARATDIDDDADRPFAPEESIRNISRAFGEFDRATLEKLAALHEWQSDHCYAENGRPRLEQPCSDCRLQRFLAEVLRSPTTPAREALLNLATLEHLHLPVYALHDWARHVTGMRARCHSCPGAPWLEETYEGDKRLDGCDDCELVCWVAELCNTMVDIADTTASPASCTRSNDNPNTA